MSKKFIAGLLYSLPCLLMLASIPFANRIHPIILGLPFLVFWLFAWMVITPIIQYSIYRVQKRNGVLNHEG